MAMSERRLTFADAADKAQGKVTLPTESQARKNIPLVRGLFDYFPNALAEVASLSQKANEKHNPGEEMHWARGKSNDHADCIARHLVDRGEIDPEDNILHDVKVAWRALAMLEEELEKRGAKPGRASKFPGEDKRPVGDGVTDDTAAVQAVATPKPEYGECDCSICQSFRTRAAL